MFSIIDLVYSEEQSWEIWVAPGHKWVEQTKLDLEMIVWKRTF